MKKIDSIIEIVAEINVPGKRPESWSISIKADEARTPAELADQINECFVKLRVKVREVAGCHKQ